MADPWSLKEEPLSPHQAASHLHLDFTKGNHNGNLQNALPRPAYKFSTAPQAKALQLLAAFAAISVVAFFAYICSTYIRRRISPHSIGRKLAAGEDGEKNDKPESCNPGTDEAAGTPEDPYSTVNPGSHASSPAEPEQTELATPPSAPITDPASTAQIPAAAIPQLGTGGEQRGVKRKARDDASGDREAKAPMLGALEHMTVAELLSESQRAVAGFPTSLAALESEETPLGAGGPSPDDWLSGFGEGIEEEQVWGWQPSAVPSTSEDVSSAQLETTGIGQDPFRSATPEQPIDLTTSSSPGTSRSAVDRQPVQHPTEAWLQARAAGPSRAPTQTTTSPPPQRSALRTLLSSPPITPSTPPEPSALSLADLLQRRGLAERAEAAVEELMSSFKWLRDMLKGVSDEMLQTHPFYRHPGPQMILSGRVFDPEKAKSFAESHQKIVYLLSECRELFKKPFLTEAESSLLMENTERLCGYAANRMPVSSAPKNAIDNLGRAFIVLDSLFCSAEVLGKSARKEVWWPWIAHHIRTAGHGLRPQKLLYGEPTWSYAVGTAVNAAFGYYRLGERPPLRLVVCLKLALVILSKSTEFKSIKWEPWRLDAEEWLFTKADGGGDSDESDEE